VNKIRRNGDVRVPLERVCARCGPVVASAASVLVLHDLIDGDLENLE